MSILLARLFSNKEKHQRAYKKKKMEKLGSNHYVVRATNRSMLI